MQSASPPASRRFFLFHLVDDVELEQWQSGLVYLGLGAKDSLKPVRKAAIAAQSDKVASCAVAAAH
jgi:hypothetical protein